MSYIPDQEFLFDVNPVNHSTPITPINPATPFPDKIFCSEWLSPSKIIVGTKDNQLLLLDVDNKRRTISIPLPPSVNVQIPNSSGPMGMHALASNPGGTLLATGGRNTSEISIFSLPILEPKTTISIHKDCIFGMEWIDDKRLITASRDGTIMYM